MENGGGDGSRWPEKVGILAMELYFPKSTVDQAELAAFDGQDPAKVPFPFPGIGARATGG